MHQRVRGALALHPQSLSGETRIPEFGSQGSLGLCRVGEQRVVLLLEGKVLVSAHGQGGGQALPGESSGEASREQASVSGTGTCQSAPSDPPLKSRHPITRQDRVRWVEQTSVSQLLQTRP